MDVIRSVVIAQPILDVFAYVSDARNDPQWCPKVRSVALAGGTEAGPGARYDVVHQPIPLRPARQVEHVCLDWEPPTRIEWRESDGADVFVVTYTLAPLGATTRLTQRTEARLSAPRLLHPLLRIGIARDVSRQLKALRGRLGRTDDDRCS